MLINLNELFKSDSNRFQLFSRSFKTRENEAILFDFSKNLISKESFDLLINLMKESNVQEWKHQSFFFFSSCRLTSFLFGQLSQMRALTNEENI